VNAYILAGGGSTRMGTDKGLLTAAGATLIEHAMRLARTITSRVFLVGNQEHLRRFGPVVRDRYTGCGPLGGIHAALTESDAEWNLCLAVDQFGTTKELLRSLAAESENAALDCQVIVPEIDGRPQPLCALYRRGFLSIAESALAAGNYKIGSLFSPAHACRLTAEALRQYGLHDLHLVNANTPEEWEALRRTLESLEKDVPSA
jgi:molybdenum cofactor guanylyltransferase